METTTGSDLHSAALRGASMMGSLISHSLSKKAIAVLATSMRAGEETWEAKGSSSSFHAFNGE